MATATTSEVLTHLRRTIKFTVRSASAGDGIVECGFVGEVSHDPREWSSRDACALRAYSPTVYTHGRPVRPGQDPAKTAGQDQLA